MSVKAARDKAREVFENPDKFKGEAQAGTFKDVAEKWFRPSYVIARHAFVPPALNTRTRATAVDRVTWTRALNGYLKGKDRGEKPPPKQITFIAG